MILPMIMMMMMLAECLPQYNRFAVINLEAKGVGLRVAEETQSGTAGEA